MSFVSSRFAISLLATLGMAGCDVTVEDEGSTIEDGELPDEVNDLARARVDELRPWAALKKEKQDALDRYLADHSAELQAFLYRPLGSAGVPSAMLRAFPVAFPDIWGTPDQFFAKQGLFKDPFNASNPFPAGLGTVNVNGVDFTTLSCAGCHLGRVQTADGTIIPLIGAPNTTFNQFRTSVENTVSDPRYFAVFGTNAGTQTFQAKVLGRRKLIDSTLGTISYGPQHTNPPNLNAVNKPGYLDAIGVASASLVIPEFLALAANPTDANTQLAFATAIRAVMPPKPSQVDIVSVWNQNKRSRAQWDGTIANPIYRNLGAAVGVIGDPAAVDYENAAITAAFNEDLPPPPYPFAVDDIAKTIGLGIYIDACESCHKDNNPTIYPASLIGTDPNRAEQVTLAQRERFIDALQLACKDPVACDVPETDIIRDIAATGRGYVAAPLDGIWARAPYLHNGSVPTLEHLLLPASSRPKQFKRGSIRYDERKVGFAWESSITDANTHVFDTNEAGASNVGHDRYVSRLTGRVYDFSRSPSLRYALLEYLKTL
jgi:mono/diheme cytochrome c family protein